MLVGNKADRVAGLNEQLSNYKIGDKVKRHELESLRGKLQFVCQNVFGMALRQASAGIRPANRVLSASDVELFSFVRAWLSSSVPRDIGCCHTPIHCVYTDGAAEDSNELVSCGAVLVPQFGAPQTFGFEIDPSIVSGWTNGDVSRQIIMQAELYPVLVARRLWADILVNSRVWFFIDNDAARQALIKGWSASPGANALLREMALLEAKSPFHSWYARVPSKSNPADAASRLKLHEVVKVMGAVICDVPADLRACAS